MVQDGCVLLYISVYATLFITLFRYAFQDGRTIVKHACPVYFLNWCCILLKYTGIYCLYSLKCH